MNKSKLFEILLHINIIWNEIKNEQSQFEESRSSALFIWSLVHMYKFQSEKKYYFYSHLFRNMWLRNDYYLLFIFFVFVSNFKQSNDSFNAHNYRAKLIESHCIKISITYLKSSSGKNRAIRIPFFGRFVYFDWQRQKKNSLKERIMHSIM